MAGYVDLERLKESLALGGETFADADLTDAITAASAAIDSMCGRRFATDEADTTRSYVPQRVDWVEIDDLAVLTSIESDTVDAQTFTPWVPGDYQLEPLNADEDGWPFTAIRLTPYSAVVPFERGFGTIRVTGKFGWPEPPAEIQTAASILSTRLLKRVREAPFGIAGMGVDGIAVRISHSDPDVAMLLSPYTRGVRLA